MKFRLLERKKTRYFQMKGFEPHELDPEFVVVFQPDRKGRYKFGDIYYQNGRTNPNYWEMDEMSTVHFTEVTREQARQVRPSIP